MNSDIKCLVDLFPIRQNPDRRAINLSAHPLTISPPGELLELLAAYGNGKFTCSRGDSIRIFVPDRDSVEFLNFALNSHLQVMENLGENYDSSEMTIPRTLFLGRGSTNPSNLIYWGHSDNGVMLLSLYLSPVLGWATLIVDGDFQRTACYFKTPATIIRGAFTSNFYAGFFPESMGPYQFEMEQE